MDRPSVTPSHVLLSDYDYDLPPERIAQAPAEPRDSARLLVLPRAGGPLEHVVFREIGRYLRPGDLLVANRSRVFPARLRGRREAGGGKVELLLLRRVASDGWEALGRPGRRLLVGTRLVFGQGELGAEVVEVRDGGERIVRLWGQPDVDTALHRIGEIPLPPYIRGWAGDVERYQTVYADLEGSAAAPTAGLHFTPDLIASLQAQGVDFQRLLLHIGLDTFRPITADDVTEHKMHAEYCEVPAEVLDAIRETRRGGGRVVAVGTTSVRALETAALAAALAGRPVDLEGLPVAPWELGFLTGEPRLRDDGGYAGWTDLFIRPGFRFRAVDGLITNFHLPRSTLLLLVSALVGRERLLAAYREAVDLGYNFYSFGDAMLIV